MKKYIIAIIVVTLLLSICAYTVHAEEISVTDGVLAEQTGSENIETEEKLTEEKLPFGEQVMLYIEKYLAEIISALTFAGTALLTYLYKKGLIPTISTVFSKLTDHLSGFKANMEEKMAEFNTSAKPVFEQMQNVIKYSEEMKKSFDKMSEQLNKSEEEKEQLRIALNTSREANMLTAKLLCDVLTCTNVPQYMKDKIIEYYEESKKAIVAPLKVVDANVETK